MTLNIMFLSLVAILLGITFEEKLIAFEDKIANYICDRIGWLAAQVVIRYRKIKRSMKVRK